MNDSLAAFLADADPRYSAATSMVGRHLQSPGYHTTTPDGTWVHPTREALDYALACLQTHDPDRAARAAGTLEAVLALQETCPTAATYGIWPWHREEPLPQMAPPDWNWADFCGARLAQILRDHAAQLPDALRAAVRAALGHAGWSIFRRNVGPGYTNIAIMGGGVTAAAGELLDEPRLLDYGRRRLADMLAHTEHHGGFNEYNSPTYTLVALHECERALYLVSDDACRESAEALRRIAWQTVADHFHPATGEWAGPHSRTYADRLSAATRAYLAEQTGVEPGGVPSQHSRPSLPQLTPSLPCPPDLVDRFRRLPSDPLVVRQRFIRREPDGASTWGTTWLSGAACLGSVNRDTLWVQRRPLLGYWSVPDAPAAVLRARFLHDGRDFASAAIATGQAGPRALSAVTLVSNQGSHHPTLDRPADGRFEAADFRLRYELQSVDATVADIGGGRYELAAGGTRAVVHTAPGRFGNRPIEWIAGRDEHAAFVEAVCHHGERRAFVPREIGEMVLAAGVEVLAAGEDAGTAPVAVEVSDGRLTAAWAAGDGLQVDGPARAG